MLKKILLFEKFISNQSKDDIMELIENIKKGSTPMEIRPRIVAWKYFYSILRENNPALFDKDKEAKMSSLWNNIINKIPQDKGIDIWDTWLGYQDAVYGKNKEGKTYNYYISVDVSDHNNVENFISNLRLLHNELKALSNTEKKSVLWKTHLTYKGFVNDNDSLKIYWYDNSIRDKVKTVVDDWIKKINLKTLPRVHNRGTDVKWYDKSNNKIHLSFGQIISHLMLSKFYFFVVKNKNYSTKDIYNSFEKNVDRIIKSIMTDFNNGLITIDKFKEYYTNLPYSLIDPKYFSKTNIS
jgi:hypothetical protein